MFIDANCWCSFISYSSATVLLKMYDLLYVCSENGSNGAVFGLIFDYEDAQKFEFSKIGLGSGIVILRAR